MIGVDVLAMRELMHAKPTLSINLPQLAFLRSILIQLLDDVCIELVCTYDEFCVCNPVGSCRVLVLQGPRARWLAAATTAGMWTLRNFLREVISLSLCDRSPDSAYTVD